MAEINKIHIGNEKITSRQSKQLLLEMNYIMPDNKPRINSIIDTNVKPVISSTSFIGDELSFNISADCVILYNTLSVSEEEEHFYTTACEFTKTFKESVLMSSDNDDVYNAESNSYLININTDNIETMLISDRKVVVKAYVTVSSVLKEIKGTDLAESFENDKIITKKSHIDNLRSVGIMRVQSYIKEDVTLAENMPSVDVVIRKDASAQIDSKKISDGKAIFYGTVHIDMAYSNLENEPHFHSSGFDVNFNQMCEIPDVSSNAILRIKPDVTELSIDAKENNILGIEGIISFDVEVYDYFSYDIAEDAFLPDMNLEINSEKMQGKDTYVLSNNIGICSEKIAVPNSDAEKVIFSQATVKACTTTVNGKNLYFDGIYSIKVLFVPKSDSNILKTATTEVPFSYMFECSTPECEITDSEIVIKSTSAEVNDYGEIVAKWVANANAIVMDEFSYNAIMSVEAKPLETQIEKAIYYHFLNNGEKIWDVAKQFSVSPSEICKMNGIEDENSISNIKGLVVIKY